jgi:spore maturation protein CgeB
MSGLRIVILGLSITSSWGNGHATTYRSLVKGLIGRGHRVTFLERDQPWYGGDNRDPLGPECGRVFLYENVADLRARHGAEVRTADAVIVGSYVAQGPEVLRWVLDTARGCTAFYDIDTPVTLAKLRRGDTEYLAPELIPPLDLYLSFAAGPALVRLREEFGARRAEALFCSVDPELYHPEPQPRRWDLGYLGTYGADRQPKLDALLIEPSRRLAAGRFVVAGPQYPPELSWPANVERIEHLPPHRHRAFYNAQAFTLNVTRADMVAAGWVPSVRIFEAAACGVPIVSDAWPGLDELLVPGEEIVVAHRAEEVTDALTMPEDRRRRMASAARARVLAEHTGAARAKTLERLIAAVALPACDRPLPA